MSIQINVQHGEQLLSSFAKTVGSMVKNGRVNIPHKYGSGYVQGFLFGNYLMMIIRNYTLNEAIIINRQTENLPETMVMIAFHNILKDTTDITSNVLKRKALPSVIISTKGFKPELAIEGNTEFNLIKVAVEASYLKQLLGTSINNTVLKSIIENNQTFIFEQLLSVELQLIAAEISDAKTSAQLHRFFYKLKAQELIYCLLQELVKREDKSLQAINIADVKALYAVKDKLVANLEKAPSIKYLATYAGMSESKLKRLFRQVFGNTIHGYFQTIRMKEAAFLLKETKLSVSEVGYQLGFSNLSHFTRVFEAHTGMKPKKFSML